MMTTLQSFAKVYGNTLHHFFIPPKMKTYFPFLSLLALGIGLLILEFVGFRKVFGYLSSLQDFPFFFIQFLLERLVGLIFLISYSMIFMSSMINGLGSFFLAKDLPFLHALPIRQSKVLAIKFIENWITSCYLIVLFLSCFLFSYVQSFNLGWEHYAFGAILVVLFTISPVALGSSVVTVLIRFFPARRIHQVVTLIGGVFLGILTIAVRMMKPERLLNPSNTDDFVRLIKDLTVPSLNHFPSSWATYIIVYGNRSKTVLLLGFTIGCLLLLAIVLHFFYDKAFVFSQESRSLRSQPSARKTVRSKHRGKIGSVVLKETKLFLRDATQWSQVLLLAALVIVYLINIKNLAIQLTMVRWVVSFINLGLAGFVLAALSVRFLFPSVSMEGRSFWIVKTLPISFRTLLWCKYLIYFPPFLLFTQMLVFFSNRILHVDAFFVQLSMANIFAIAFALTGLAIGIGALMPNFKSDNPAKIAVGPGGVLYMLLSFIYISLMLIMQIRPVWYHVIRASDNIHGGLYFLGAILLTLVVALVPMEWGARRLASQEYT